MKPVLFDTERLDEYCKEHKIQPFRQKQVVYEIFKNQNINFDDMTTLSKDMRKDLSDDFDILSLQVDTVIEDGETTKIWFKTHDGHIVEAVLIYHYKTSWSKSLGDKEIDKSKLNRITLCVSCQVWCPVWCIFCVTGKLWIKRNLERHEILSQLLYANSYIKEKFGKKEDGTLNRVRNVVFMWMGEPLLNYDNVKKSIDYMLPQNYLSLSKRHITISTAGIVPGIQKMIEDKLDVMLAVSLHAPNQSLREKLIPFAKAYKLEGLMKVLNDYVKATNNRLFYEYIMIKDLTDRPELAEELAKLIKKQLCHVNLIPYNQNPAIDLKESELRSIKKFKEILESRGVTVTARDSMGRDAKWACGQLGYEKVKDKE